jgi:hypothetical protein
MVQANLLWRAPRIHGELQKLSEPSHHPAHRQAATLADLEDLSSQSSGRNCRGGLLHRSDDPAAGVVHLSGHGAPTQDQQSRRIAPGATQFTRMPNSASSMAATLVNCSMPPLLAVYETRRGNGCLLDPEPMLTMQLLNVRYQRDFRDNVTQLQRVLISTPSGAQIPVEHFRD